ncbi:MAG: hypothetical protein ABIU05_24040 [Nitrospirales bacterium]
MIIWTYRSVQAMCGYPLTRLSRTLGKGLLRTPLHPQVRNPARCGAGKGLAAPLKIPDRRYPRRRIKKERVYGRE